MVLDPYQQTEEEKKKQQQEQQSADLAKQQADQQAEAAKQLQKTTAPTTPTPAAQPVQRPGQQPIQPVARTPQQPAQQQFGPPAQQLQQPTTTRKRTPAPVTSYQRLQDYLRTSQPQAQGLGSSVQQDIMSEATAGRQALGQAAQSFSQKVDEAGLTRNADRTSQLISKAANLKAGESLTAEELAELQKIASTQQGFEGLAPADLTAISEYATAQQKLGEAKTKAGLSGTEAGRQALLSNIYGKTSPYTSGQSQLDQLLTGSSQAPAAQLAATREELVGKDVLGQELSTAEKAAVAKRLAEQQEVGKAAEDVTTSIGMERGQGALGGLETSILDKVSSENEKVARVNALIDQAIAEGGIEKFGSTTAQMQLIRELGLTPEQIADIQATGGIRSNELFTKLKELNEQTATSPEEFARLQALYSIGDAFGREAQKLAVTEGKDLGSLLGQKAGLDVDKIMAAKKENEDLVNAEGMTRAANLKSVKPVDYRFGRDMDVTSAANDIMKRMTDYRFVESDNAEADKVLQTYGEQLADYNKFRQSKGVKPLPAIDLSDAKIMEVMEPMFRNSGFAATWRTMGSGFKGLADLQKHNPAGYAAMKEQAKRVLALEQYNQMFGIGSPQWRK